MRISKRILIPLALSAVLLSACGSAGTATPQDVNAVYTGVVETIVASYFDTQTAQVPPAKPIPTLPIITFPAFTQGPLPTAIPSATRPFYTATIGTIAPTLTPSPTGTLSTPTINPSVLAFGCNNLAFVRDVTLPPGTVLKPGEDFTKTWKVANIGTCPWMYVYRLVLVSGNDFGAPPLRLGRVVAVNSWAEISLQMGAPKKGGTYTSYWRLADGDGNMFGATLVVSFTVVEPTKTPVPPTDTTVPTDAPGTPGP